LFHFICEFNFFTVLQESGASTNDSLWSTLDNNPEAFIKIVVGVIIGHVSDEKVEFNVRGEWDGALDVLVTFHVSVSWEFISSFVKVVDSVGELNETGLGGITFAVSVDKLHFLLSALQSSR